MGWKNNPEKRKEGHRNYMRKRYNEDQEHRQKQLIRVKTKYVDKPNRCEECGGPNPEAHHPDYNKPDLRIWLCRQCHLNKHVVAD